LEALQRILIVTGPTGGGKSERAISLAEELNGEIVSADSVAIYKGFDIGSAKPSREELARVRHYLVSEVEPTEFFSAGEFIRRADLAISEIVSRGKVPIVVGGTGMYLKALLHGLIADEKTGPVETEESLEEQFAALKMLDPLSADKLHPADTARISRALEYVRRTGSSIQTLKQEHANRELRYSALVLLLEPERETLYPRINLRSAQMLEQGIIEEVTSLLRNYPKTAMPFSAIGYRQVVNYLEQVGITREELAGQIAQETRRFAKRQYTWWRNEPAKLGWHRLEAFSSEIIPRFLERSGVFKQDVVTLVRLN